MKRCLVCGCVVEDNVEKCPQCGGSLYKTTGRIKKIHCLKEGCGYEASVKK